MDASIELAKGHVWVPGQSLQVSLKLYRECRGPHHLRNPQKKTDNAWTHVHLPVEERFRSV